MKLNPRTKTNGMLTSLRIAVACMLVVAGAGMALYAQSADEPSSDSVKAALKKSKNGVYMVQMREAPAATYKGGVAGYKATAKPGQKIDPLAPDVVKYVGYLKA